MAELNLDALLQLVPEQQVVTTGDLQRYTRPDLQLATESPVVTTEAPP